MKKLSIILFALCAALAVADEVRIQDGTIIKGSIQSIDEDSIVIETGFAGTLTVARNQVTGFSTDENIHIRLASGAVMPGTVDVGEDQMVEVTGVDGVLRAPMTAVKQGWVKAGQDPERLALEQAAEELKRKWKFNAAANVSGKSGNTDEKSLGANFSAVLAGKEDELKFYASVDRKETEGSKSSDERKAGMRYTSYFNDPWGWYVRQEFEQDEFENIKLRSLTGAGLSYRFADEENYKLSANAGLGYRYETYEDGSADGSNVGLDLGLQHFCRMNNRFELNNELTFVPSIEDFANYLVTQHSWIDFPLGDSKLWKVRLGLRNDYNSQPLGDRKKLDTTYYSSLAVYWE